MARIQAIISTILFIQTISSVIQISSALFRPENSNHPHNIIFLLTDDQDSVLGGMEPLTKVRKLIAENGAEFQNMFVNTPLCCPSRASVLTGRHVHNHKTSNNSLSGNCNSQFWQKGPEKSTFVTYLKKQNYTTFYAGKYMNQYGRRKVGGVKHIPPGWDWWYGLVGNSVYYNYTLSVNGTAEVHGENPEKDYLTNLIGKRALEFLTNYNPANGPFFMMLSMPSPHEPFTPAPNYAKNFSEARAPRIPTFNKPGGKGKHWLVRQPPSPLSQDQIDRIDLIFRNRWRTLLSVQDVVEQLIGYLTSRGLLDSTYIFYSSDNGYHLGEFSLPKDKRQPYEFDVRVPLLVRGPGIAPNISSKAMVMNIDLAPTFLEIAGIDIPQNFDGLSLLPLLKSNISEKDWQRQKILVDHVGEARDGPEAGCPQYTDGNMFSCNFDCICEDSRNNTYSCIRTLSGSTNTLYCEFDDDENFVEFYNMASDPYQIKNIYSQLSPSIKKKCHLELQKMKNCQGRNCVKF